MNGHYDRIGESGLRFFGKVSASISHELKNVLAIINENAGLLEDLAFAAERGAAIDPARLNRACQNFFKQIHRADDILKNMNRFAHSVDQFEAQVNLVDLAGLVASLAGRLAAMRKLIIEVVPASQPVMITTNPFLLENLLWLFLEMAIGSASEAGTVLLIPELQEKGCQLRITGLAPLGEDYAAKMPPAEILLALGAQLDARVGATELILRLG